MNCPECDSTQIKRNGKDRKGNQRFSCLACEKRFQVLAERPLGAMTLPMDKAVLCLKLLIEGMSIASVQRITGVEKHTILSLIEVVGQKCEALMHNRIKAVSVSDVQCDEIWGFVGMKEQTKKKLALMPDEETDQMGDAYCFVALESNTKLILAFHLGRRTVVDTVAFTAKLDRATKGRFQVNTDGFTPYREAFNYALGHRTDFAQIIKVFGKPEGDEHRYSMPKVIDMEKTAIHGTPDMEKATTSHVESQNLTIRMSMRRMTRLTNAYSKKFINLHYSYALHFAHYNFCRVHSSIRVTPAMESGLTNRIWSIEDLLTA